MGSAVFFVLALFTKETALVLPVLCLLYMKAHGRTEKNTLMPLGAGWVFAFLLWLPLRHMALQNPISLSALETGFSVIKNMPATIQLLGKALLPFNVSVLPILQDTTFVFGFLSVAIIAALFAPHVIHRRARGNELFMAQFGLAWFALFLWPSFIRTDLANPADFIEHRLYVPIIGLLISAAESQIIRYIENRYRNWFLFSGVLMISLFFGINFAHQDNFADKMAFWRNAARNSPHSSLAQKNLGAMYYLEKNYSLAEEYSKKALAINPYETMAHNNLGLIYASYGQFERAHEEYLKELSFNYSYDSAHYNLGLLYYQMGYTDDAKKHWEKTLEINPGYADAAQMLGILNAE